MPSAPIVTCARIFPLLAAVTPRSRYLKKERRPATRGAVAGVAYASLPGGFTAAGGATGDFASFIIGASLDGVAECVPLQIVSSSYYPIHRAWTAGRGSACGDFRRLP